MVATALADWARSGEQILQSSLAHPGAHTLGLVFVGGLLTSLGPCSLSLLPVTLAYLAGFDNDIQRPWRRSLSFCAGISLALVLLGLASGARTIKMKFGHHGANHPVQELATGRVLITSQNHGFCVDPVGIEKAGGKITHLNLYDGTLEGFYHPDLRVMCVQFHPEAAPGPHDSAHLLMERYLRFAGI